MRMNRSRNCSRLFRRLIAGCTEEFAQSSFCFLDWEMMVLPGLGNEGRSAGRKLSCDLQLLCGEDALKSAFMYRLLVIYGIGLP